MKCGQYFIQIMDIEINTVPSAFLVLSDVAHPAARNRDIAVSEGPVETYDSLLVVRTVWESNFEHIALHLP